MVELREIGSIVALFLFFLLLAMLVVGLAAFMREINENLAIVLLSPLYLDTGGVSNRTGMDA